MNRSFCVENRKTANRTEYRAVFHIVRVAFCVRARYKGQQKKNFYAPSTFAPKAIYGKLYELISFLFAFVLGRNKLILFCYNLSPVQARSQKHAINGNVLEV